MFTVPVTESTEENLLIQACLQTGVERIEPGLPPSRFEILEPLNRAQQEKSPIAVQNCWRTASRNPPRFEYEGAFRSWLVRILIDEALYILYKSQGARDAAAADVNTVSLFDSTLEPGLG